MDKKLKILLLPDHLDKWSACNRCFYLKKYITEHDFTILGGLDKEVYYNQLKFAEEYDFVHINFTGSLEYWYPFYEKYPEKLLITVINERSVLNGVEVRNMEKFDEMLFGCCGATSVGYRIADMYRGMEYIPNGVDLDEFKSPKKCIVGYSGTKRVNKNIQILEKVCDDLKLELHMAVFENQRIEHEDMYQFYRQLDVFVHPSFTEGCSNPILEALAMNVPVICTDAGIVQREFAEYVTIIKPTYQSLYNALRKYCTREIIEEKFQWTQICARYSKFYERCYVRQLQILKDKNVIITN